VYGPLMSVGSGWISQMDVGMIETSNELDNNLYRHNGNDADDYPLRVEYSSSALLWIVALVLSLVFHAWLIKQNQLPLVTKVIPELSSSQSISIQFTTFNPENPVVEAKPKIENTPIVSDPVVPVKATKPKPTVASKEKLKVVEKTSNKPITLEKKKLQALDPIRVVKITTRTPDKEVVQSIEALPNHVKSDKQVELTSSKIPFKKITIAKQKTTSKVVETYESHPLIKNPQFLKPPNKPKYPRLAKRKNQQGISIIRAKISSLGIVDEVRLHQTSGHHLLDKSAMNAFRYWQFKPATKAGVTVTTWVQVPVKFQLEN
jgi:protein TonB